MKPQPCFYVRFRWLKRVDMKEAAKDFGENSCVVTMIAPTGDYDFLMFKEHREELRVMADTLRPLLSPKRALLYQRKTAPFTLRDIWNLEGGFSSCIRMTGLSSSPFFFSSEPKYDVAK